MLDKDISLGEKIRTLFREQGITIASILTAIGMAIGVLVEALLPLTREIRYETQVQHGMGPLINMQKSVFLPLWDNYDLYGRKSLQIESFLAIESENLVRISIFVV